MMYTSLFSIEESRVVGFFSSKITEIGFICPKIVNKITVFPFLVQNDVFSLLVLFN